LSFFYRQALQAGNRVPMLMAYAGFRAHQVLKKLHLETGAEIGEFGSAGQAIPITTSVQQAASLPFAVRYYKCSRDVSDECKKNKYRTACWVQRPDVTPPTAQLQRAGHSFHPGFRWLQLVGRSMAFVTLMAIESALDEWQHVVEVRGAPLPDEFWHLTERYSSVRQKLRNYKGYCETSMAAFLPRVCRTAMRGKTEFTPRANPEESSLLSIVKAAPNGYVPTRPPLLYEGPNLIPPLLQVPSGSVDVHRLVGGRRCSAETSEGVESSSSDRHGTSRALLDGTITPGLGWSAIGPNGYCDGTISSQCNRMEGNRCLLMGHNDGRGGLLGDGLSGWLVMHVRGVRQGIIIVRMETWHSSREHPRTAAWKDANNGSYERRLREVPTPDANSAHVSRPRALRGPPPPPQKDQLFDVSLNGRVTTWNASEFQANAFLLQRVVQLWKLLDDESLVGKEADYEVGIRLRGCASRCVFSVSHIYWA